jgi:serine phosphatase RsbU (regulator of sigma subunit)
VVAATTERSRLRQEYELAFSAWTLEGRDDALELAHDVGRDAMRRGSTLLDVVEVHGEVVASVGREVAADAAVRFLLEAVSVFELARQSFADAHRVARAERANADRLQRLADASVAMAAAPTVDARLTVAVDAARELLAVDAARASIASDGDEPGVVVGDADRRAPAVRTVLTTSDGSPIGELVVWPVRGEQLAADDEAVLTQLANITAIAVEKGRLFQREHRIAATLQRSLLVQALPVTPGVALAARYRPALRGTQVGGDLYDAVVLPRSRLALAVGDVTGRGVRAAAVMGQLRIGLRAYAVQDASPREVLDSVDRLLQSLGDAPLATAVFVVLDPTSGKLCLANAGHPPPLLVGPPGGDPPRFVTGGVSPPLGVGIDAPHDEVELEAAAGSTLLLYTDGLVESREVPLDVGLRRLRQVAAGLAAATPDELCDTVLARLLPEGTDDDVALLACQLSPA